MNSQNDKEGTGHVRAAIIGGMFAVLAACVGGFFLILNTMVDNGVIVFGMSNPKTQPTAIVGNPTTYTENPTQIPQNQEPIFAPTATLLPTETAYIGVESIVLPDAIISGWTSNVWSNGSGAKAQDGCARLWRDLTYKGGERDYIELCDEQRDFTNTDWNDQIKEVEVDCSLNNTVIVTIWQNGGFSGGQWQQTFCSQ